jgi:hypothetical protein
VSSSRSSGKLSFVKKIRKKLDPPKFRVAYLHRQISKLEGIVWTQADEIQLLSERISKLENR